ncbi:hypothetical protein V2H45_04320 [Tumidithrix elongata RA019]|uniref:SPOR domain-containing protein n=1 Tax=Tumidithrix elongata BACA0141 TaxID=2716417 RepID=A0AAW9PQW1_9CYAN|nr:hypothetical protein [Tumidithrix elongata RA019]
MQTLSPNITSRATEPSEDEDLPSIAKSSVLQAALSGLDANLNDELERYRHWQANGQSYSYLNPFRPSGKSSAWSPVRGDGHKDDRYENATLPTIPMNPSKSPIRTDASAAIRELQLPLNQKVADDSPRPFSYTDATQPDAFAYKASYGSAHPSMNAANVTANTSARTVNDEELLRDISNSYQEQDEYVEPSVVPQTPETNIFSSLMNPVGIISLMLLLVSSALIGFLIVDPSGLVRLLKHEQKNNQSSALSDPNSDVSISAQNREPSLSVPNSGLSTDKNGLVPFVPLPGSQSGQTNSSFTSTSPNAVLGNTKPSTSVPLRSLPNANLSSSSLPPVSSSYETPRALRPVESYLEPVPQPTTRSRPQQTSRPVAQPTTRPSSNVAVRNVPTPAPVQTSAPNVETSVPSTFPPVKYSAPISSVSTANSGSNYRVVVDGSYASKVQQVEKDAFVRSDGQTQVGAYQDVNAARQRAEQLRRQGIPARVN